MLGRTLSFAKFELVHGRAGLLLELPQRLVAVTEEQIQEAARELAPRRRAVVELIPGGAR